MKKDPMSDHVITVLFTVKPDSRDQFRQALLENSARSLALETGCKVFDVCESPVASEFFLYEVYASEQDFRAHLQTEHFREFDELCLSCVIDKQVTSYARLQN